MPIPVCTIMYVALLIIIHKDSSYVFPSIYYDKIPSFNDIFSNEDFFSSNQLNERKTAVTLSEWVGGKNSVLYLNVDDAYVCSYTHTRDPAREI